MLSVIEQWKRDYVYLLQSSITVPTGDLTDGMEVRLYGGNRVSIESACLGEVKVVGLFSRELLV